MKSIIKKILFIFLLFIFCGNVYAEVINQNVNISEKGYKKLSKYMSAEEMQMIDKKTYDLFMNSDVIAYKSYVVETTYYNDNFSLPRKVNERVMSVEEYLNASSTTSTNCITTNNQQECETNMKYMRLIVFRDGVDNLSFYLSNEWKSMPKYKSFDVMAIRWTGDFSVGYYYASQTTNGNSGNISYKNGNGNYKVGTKAIGISQNLVDSATKIDNDFTISGICSSSGTVYATYQHAQANITLATSKLYNFSSSGYGGVLSFYGNASGKYDNTQGLSLSYTC